MRICFASKQVAGLRTGGIGTYVTEAARALKARGHEVWLITDDSELEHTRVLDDIPDFDRVISAGDGVKPSDRHDVDQESDPHSYSLLVHQTLEATDVKFDYIEFPDSEAQGLVPMREQRTFGAYGSTVLGVMLHGPTFERVNSGEHEHRTVAEINDVCRLEDQMIGAAPMVNSSSAALRDQVVGRLGLDRDVAVIRYPMRLDSGPPPGPSPRTSTAELSFLYFGPIERSSGIEVLFDAFAALPELRLTVIGDHAPDTPRPSSFLASIWRRAPVNIQFEPEPMPSWLRNRIRDSDICLFPSQLKSWSTDCADAMAAARVVITSSQGGMFEAIEAGESGFVFDGCEPDDLVRVIREELPENLSRLDAIGAAAAVRIRELTDRDVYCDALEQRVHRFLGQN